MSEEDSSLNELFPTAPPLVFRGRTLEIKKLTLQHMALANELAKKAFGVMSFEKIQSELDAAVVITDCIMEVLQDKDTENKLKKVLCALSGINDEEFVTLTTPELVEIIIAVVRYNSDFFILRLPMNLKEALELVRQ